MKKNMEELKNRIMAYEGPPVRIMEVCGTHTHEIFRLGIRKLLPKQVELISGPGCPVCVTPADYIDKAIWLALEKKITICTFGDLVRVPGTEKSLSDARAEGAKIQIVYSPTDAADYAKKHQDEEVVFLSVGFETTTPAACISLKMAEKEGLKNYSLLTANKTMPQAYEALKGSADVFLYPGHVNAITGTALCEELVEKRISGVVAGFEAEDLLEAFAVILDRYPKGEPFFVNAYKRVVTKEGSVPAAKLVAQWMEACDSEWRGLGVIKGSGLRICHHPSMFDARIKYQIPKPEAKNNPVCRCGEVLQGKCRPTDCPVFGTACTPLHPVGACMVSGEGACSAYYQYGGEIND